MHSGSLEKQRGAMTHIGGSGETHMELRRQLLKVFLRYYYFTLGSSEKQMNISVCLSLSVSVSLSLCLSVTYGYGSVLFWQHCDTLCSAGFVDDVIFLYNGPVVCYVYS